MPIDSEQKTFRIRKLITSAICVMAACSVQAASADSASVNYIPKLSGNLRMKYEYSTVDDVSRFKVSNARLKLDGKVLPWVGYRLQVDLCNKGKIRLMDAYAKLTPMERLDIFLGQERVPFSIDASRDIHEYMFADLSFGARYLGNLRSVGAKAGYRFLGKRAYVEGGLFNSGTTDTQNEWNGEFTYGAKLNYKTDFGLMPQVAFMSRKPLDGVRHNMADVSLSWAYAGFFVEGEYIYCNYAGHGLPDAHTYNFIVDYTLPVNKGILSNVSFRGRFDGMTGISTGIPNDEGEVGVNYPECKRLTAGVKFASIFRKANLSFHLNYMQYFYDDDSGISADDNNRLVAMFVLHF